MERFWVGYGYLWLSAVLDVKNMSKNLPLSLSVESLLIQYYKTLLSNRTRLYLHNSYEHK